MLATEHAFQFNQINPVAQTVQAADDLAIRLFILLLDRQLKQHLCIFKVIEIFFPNPDQILQLAELPLHPLGLGLIVPEVRTDRLPFQQFYLFNFVV